MQYAFPRFYGSIAIIRFEFQVTKWPPNDLKWPILTWKHNFLTKSHFGACNMSLIGFFWRLSRLRLSDLRFESPNYLNMTSSDPYWPQDISPNLTLGHVICLFIVFFLTLSRLHLISSKFRVSKWPPSDLQMTSSDPYSPQNKPFSPNLT